MELKGINALVTGASSGIGRAAAVAFASKGATVLINYRNNKAGADKTLKEVEQHSKGSIFQADVSELDQCQKMFEDIKSKHSTLDILVNNAGDARPGELNNYEMWDYQLKNILMSAVNSTSCFLELKGRSTPRKIVNITSMYGLFSSGCSDFFQYSAAKAAMNSLSQNLAKKYAPKVLTNAVAPGFTLTPAWEGVNESDMKAISKNCLTGRFITPEEVAEVVVFLAQNDSMNGEIVKIDTGTTLVDV